MKIYTKTGDDGTTGLFSGKRVSKSSSYIEAYGNVDELNSWIGYCLSGCKDKEFQKDLLLIQHDLHTVCADLATPIDSNGKISRVGPNRATHLEKLIDKFEIELSPLTRFILAGGTALSSQLHIARTVCRRAERSVYRHSEQEKVNHEVIVYLNRLSDLLFVMARVANHRAGVQDVFWDQA
ncbi:MAG: ATP/cobalamin adenosyltransferase [Bacteriovoracaceae bacterium]|nr:ATP/cobalamin adenosyltransferase [Bacteriovoracaceae bacterium]